MNILRGWIRERVLLKKILYYHLLKNSPFIRNYIKGIARVTGLSEEEIEKSLPVQNLLKKILGEE